jgi:hypothetical protein
MTSGGWSDYVSPANLRAFEQLPAAASKKMVWGPDPHWVVLKDVHSTQRAKQGGYVLDLWPTSYVFARRHRIRLSLAGGADKAADVELPQGPGASRDPATIRLQPTRSAASLTLPLIGANVGPFLQQGEALRATAHQ